jgi:hypothetical protein
VGKELSLDQILAADSDRMEVARSDLWRAYRAALGRGVRLAADGQSRRFDAGLFSAEDVAALGRIEARLGLAPKERLRHGEALARYEQALADAGNYAQVVQDFAEEERAIEDEANRLGPERDALARRVQKLLGRRADLDVAAGGQPIARNLREDFPELLPERDPIPGPIPQQEEGSSRASGAR